MPQDILEKKSDKIKSDAYILSIDANQTHPVICVCPQVTEQLKFDG